VESPPEKRIPDREPAFLAADMEIAVVLGELRRWKTRPHVSLSDFVLVKRSRRIPAVADAVHMCPQFKRIWTVAAPSRKTPLRYIGLLFAMHHELCG